jgi:hypothetical protein
LLRTACDRTINNHDQSIDVDLAIDDQILRIVHAQQLRLVGSLPFNSPTIASFSFSSDADAIGFCSSRS